MEENRKAGRNIRELNLGEMEQVTGGIAPLPTKSKYCDCCKKTTKWIFLNGGFVCSQCGNAAGITQVCR